MQANGISATKGYWPTYHGFDINQGGIAQGGPYGGRKYFSPYGNPCLADGSDGEHLPDRLASETVMFMTANRDKPFLAYLSFYSVHTPLISRTDLRNKYLAKQEKLGLSAEWGEEHLRQFRLAQEHTVYAEMVEAMDLAVGKVLSALDELSLSEHTIVFFMSDNGGLSTSEGYPTSNLPLRGGKGWMYEGGIREPMIVRWPGITKAGSIQDSPVTSVDFFPTIMDAAGIETETEIDGVSFIPALHGNKHDRGSMFWHYPHYGNQGRAPTGAVRHGKWKLVEWYEDGKLELFNLQNDISEKNNLAN